MIKDSKVRAKLRQLLIWLNIGLVSIFILLVIMWLLVIRPGQIKTATAIGHYVFYSIDHVTNNENKIKADYIGDKAKAVASSMEEQAREAEEKSGGSILPGQSVMADSTDHTKSEPEELLDKAEEILKKSNTILGEAGKSAEIPAVNTNRKGTPEIAIIVTNLGLNRRSTELALTLPKQCALGFLPYTKSLKPLLFKAQSDGHEIYLYLPLESGKSSDNPGRYALMTNLPPEENSMRLSAVLTSQAKYEGVYSNFKEVFTQDKNAAGMIFDHLEDKNLIFLLGRESSGNLPDHISEHSNVVPTDVIIDLEPDREAIEKGLKKLVEVANKQGVAVGYAHGFTLTIEMIRDWLPFLEKQGIRLVPVSKLIKGNRV